jgi:hypothetical protein
VPIECGRVCDARDGESRLVGKLDGSRGMVCCRRLLIHKKKHDRVWFVWLKDKLYSLPFSGTRRLLVGPTGDRVKAKVALRVGRGLEGPSLRALKDYRGSEIV